MKTLIAPLVFWLFAAPCVAQEAVPPPPGEVEEGFSLMEEGAKLLFKGLMSSMEPAMEDMGRALTEMEPALKDLMALMGDIQNYNAPEMLENGDIIIRRKSALEMLQKGPQIEL
jgi:hypothetical protein